jgi:hypothetical protein
MEEISEETKTLTISLTTHYLNQVEAVLGLLSFAGFGWLLILLFDVLTNPPVIMANPASYGSKAGIWIQGVQFVQLIASMSLMSLVGLFRTARTVIPWIRKALR